jgi:histidinol-phosphatase (PHP family)
MKFDLHTHHERCGHAKAKIEDYIRAAIKNDLQIIGISDHSPFFASDLDQEIPGVAMGKREFPSYVEEVLQLKEKYRGQIEVLLGVESDFFADHYPLYRDIYAQYPFDYIIGSVHFSNASSIFDKKRWENVKDEDVLNEKEHYYQLIKESAQSGVFDILGHIDAMKGFYPDFTNVQTPKVEEALKLLGEAEATIEVNTSGKNKDCGGWYPSYEMLEMAYFYNIGVTFGSDAHVPERVGDEFEEVRTKLKEIGFNNWTFYRQRKRQLLPL